MNSKIKVGIIGATGYTGLELVRILALHPNVQIEVITSETYTGKKFSDIHTHLKGIINYQLYAVSAINKFKLDVVFLALPHGISMDFVKNNGIDKFKIIDLSGDFRIKNPDVYKEWYKLDHVCPDYLKEAVFGLPEVYFNEIARAKLIANPGCYPTSSILPLIPFLKNNIIDPTSIIIDSKSGVTGAGAKAKETTHFPKVNDNFTAYGILNHRHTPEIEQNLNNFSNNKAQIIFTPHLLPVNRGILSTIYCKAVKNLNRDDLYVILEKYYKEKPFVNIVNNIPTINDVRGSNYCNIFVTINKNMNQIIMVSVIDNLVKGASGQAVQNMNIMFGLDEKTGLTTLPLTP